MRLGLILGGGGIVGIAWETGVLYGLAQTCRLEPDKAAVIVGSSAGSVIGSQVALGIPLEDLVGRLRRTAGRDRPAAPQAPLPESPILSLMQSSEGRTLEGAVRIGRMAMEADTILKEDDFIASFARMLGSDEWPAADLRITSTRCSDGRRAVWTSSSGIGLMRAVASSCAIPGFFPTISFQGERYMDGPRGSGFHAEIFKDDSLDAILFVGPNAALGAFADMMRAELDALSALGCKLHAITGGEVAGGGRPQPDGRVPARGSRRDRNRGRRGGGGSRLRSALRAFAGVNATPIVSPDACYDRSGRLLLPPLDRVVR
jgi:NTE family protein